jgi:hypothetical protein
MVFGVLRLGAMVRGFHALSFLPEASRAVTYVLHHEQKAPSLARVSAVIFSRSPCLSLLMLLRPIPNSWLRPAQSNGD